MTIMDKLKGLFHRRGMGDEARGVFDRAKSTRELLAGLDDLLTRNEVELKALQKQIAHLEDLENESIGRIREGLPEGRRKRNALVELQRLRKQLENLDSRQRIYDRNMSLHLNLIGKIQDMEAMELSGVKEGEIDRIVMDFEEQFEKWQGTVMAGEVAVRELSGSVADDVDTAALERELLGPARTAQPEADPELAKLEAEIMKARPAAEKPARAKDLED